MWIKVSLLLIIQWALRNEFGIASAKPMIGNDVRQVDENEFPYIVSISKIDLSGNLPSLFHLCTSTLISRQDVLTVGHCIQDAALNEIRVIVGSVYLLSGLHFYPEWWITYNQWSEQANMPSPYVIDDLAMIRLSQRVPREIRPAMLLTLSNNDLYGLEVISAGWGISNTGTSPMFMESANLRVLPNEECEDRSMEILGYRLDMDYGIFCTATEPYVLLQYGDSGGPVLYNGMIVGVNVGTAPLLADQLHPRKINIHFNVSNFRLFILDVQNTA